MNSYNRRETELVVRSVVQINHKLAVQFPSMSLWEELDSMIEGAFQLCSSRTIIIIIITFMHYKYRDRSRGVYTNLLQHFDFVSRVWRVLA